MLVILIAAMVIALIYSGIFSKKGSSPAEVVEGARGKVTAVDLGTKIKVISDALDLYYMDHDEYPEILDVLVPNYLRTDRELLDPWNSRFRIERDENMNLILVSAGRDGTWGSPDDIRRRI